jgi:hypothetical protein
MLADFEIMIHDVDKPLGVRVVVHDNLRAMRSAVTQQDRRWYGKRKKLQSTSDLMAVCQRYHMQNSPIYSTVRFAKSHIGAGIVAHEMAHVAVWLWEIKHQFKPTAIANDHENEEWFAWILGELVRQTTQMLYKTGVYT